MATSSWLATWLDLDHLVQRQVTLHGPLDGVGGGANVIPVRAGTSVAEELGGRKLLRYLTAVQFGQFRNGSDAEAYVTPTPYTSDEAGTWLVLPIPWIRREHVLVLDPARIPRIQGPMLVAGARGVQYILPEGFPAEAIVVPGAPGVHWEIEVR